MTTRHVVVNTDDSGAAPMILGEHTAANSEITVGISSCPLNNGVGNVFFSHGLGKMPSVVLVTTMNAFVLVGVASWNASSCAVGAQGVGYGAGMNGSVQFTWLAVG